MSTLPASVQAVCAAKEAVPGQAAGGDRAAGEADRDSVARDPIGEAAMRAPSVVVEGATAESDGDVSESAAPEACPTAEGAAEPAAGWPSITPGRQVEVCTARAP